MAPNNDMDLRESRVININRVAKVVKGGVGSPSPPWW